MDLNDLNSLDVLCLICLTGSEKNMCLNTKLYEKRKDSPSVLKAVERVTAVKIELDETYPSVICPTCLNSVRISYDLIEQFQNTQKLLTEYFPKVNQRDPVENIKSFKNDIASSSDYIDLDHSTSIANISEDIEPEDSDEYLIFQIEDHDGYEESFDNVGNDLNANDNLITVDSDNECESGISLSNSYSINQNITKLDDKVISEKPVNSLLSQEDNLLLQDVSKIHYCCTGCQRVYSTIKHLKKHEENCVRLKQFCLENIKRKKLNVDEFECQYVSEMDQELFESALLLKYSCDRCSKMYTSENKLKKHQLICTKPVYKRELVEYEQQIDLSMLEENKSQPKLIEKINLDSLSQTEKDIFQSALKLQHKCPYCHNFFSSLVRCNKHLKICRKREKILGPKVCSRKNSCE